MVQSEKLIQSFRPSGRCFQILFTHKFCYRAKNCYLSYGTSYLPQWQHDSFRTRHVLGDVNAAKGTYENLPLKTGELSLGPAHKIIQGDWAWHANRGNTDKKSIWHNYKGRSRFNMLFGDGHVEFYEFPDPKQMEIWSFVPGPSRDWKWW